MKSLVISENALHALCAISPSGDWLLHPTPLENYPLLVDHNDRFSCIRTRGCRLDSRLTVVDAEDDEIFEYLGVLELKSLFDRIFRLSLHSMNAEISLNPKWMPFHHNNILSVFAFGVGRKERILSASNYDGNGNCYIFAVGVDDHHFDLKNAKPNKNLYGSAIKFFEEVIASDVDSTQSPNDGFIELADLGSEKISLGRTYSDWYPALLTGDQLRFVNQELNAPLRLRGAAGTGKTLAMAIKALKTKYDADNGQKIVKILFLTHSWAMAEHVDKLIESLDDHPGGRSNIDVFPLLSMAERDYSDIGRLPLGSDSAEGKRESLKMISAAIQEFIKGDWAAYKSGCSPELRQSIEAEEKSREYRVFLWDTLIEFGCVLAAQGILIRSSDRETYLRIRRQKWMMNLPTKADREVIFALWIQFMRNLKEQGYIQADQIISDYLNDLSTFYWEAAREENGYDVIFVDEMHLFNAQERLIFHNLLRDGDSTPIVVMALDPQQSPRETFVQVQMEGDRNNANIYERAGLSGSKKIDLKDVFRYTPEISNLIDSIRENAPGLDLSEDWDIPSGTSMMESGPMPTFSISENLLDTFKKAFDLASELQRDARKNDGRLAILCMDSDRFESYLPAATAQKKDEVFIISSREDVDNIRYAGKKAIFSTPEYVAGLQFDSVILLDVNQNLVPDGKFAGFHLRRFISELYLGISRAQRSVTILAAKDGGGLSPLLDTAIAGGLLVSRSQPN